MSSDISSFSMEEDNVENVDENQQEEQQPTTTQTNYLFYFNRLFYIRKVIKEDDINEILQKHFPTITISPLMRELNEMLQAYRMEIKRTINQENGDFVYALNTKDIDDINKIGCFFDQNDLKRVNDLFNLIIENNYHVNVDALDEDFSDVYLKLKELNYYIEKDGMITFGPMYLVNQEVDDLGLPRCEICNLYGSVGVFCSNSECNTFYHVTCLKRMGRDSHTCSRCRTHLNYDN